TLCPIGRVVGRIPLLETKRAEPRADKKGYRFDSRPVIMNLMDQGYFSFVIKGTRMIGLPRLRFVRLTLLTLLVFAFGYSIDAAAPEDVSVARMKKDLFFLASEECEGR